MVAEDTFRPPWFHRNVMSEFMGLVHGEYDAKGAASPPAARRLHNCMSGHGPDQASYDKARRRGPQAAQDRRHPGLHVRDADADPDHGMGAKRPTMQLDYDDVWTGFEKGNVG